MGPRARVVLATYNQAEFLPRVLLGYLRQTSTDFCLAIADDGSGPEARGVIEEFWPEFEAKSIGFEHIWHEDTGWHKNAIMNEAVRREGDEALLIFSDGDCIPPAHFVARHIEAHESWSFHVAGCFRLSEAASLSVSEAKVEAGTFETLGSPEDFRTLEKKKRQSRWGTLVQRRNRPKIIGLNMAVDRELFESINGFDEVFAWPYFGEDSDLRDRLMRQRPRPKVKVLYTRNDVFHLHHPTTPVRREDNREYYRRKRPVRCVKGLVYLSVSA